MTMRGIYTVPSISNPNQHQKTFLGALFDYSPEPTPSSGRIKIRLGDPEEKSSGRLTASSFDTSVSLPLTFPTTLYIFRVTIKGEGDGHPLRYSCLENPVDRGGL